MYGQLISSVTVGAGGATSIDFTSIPQSYTDLCLVVSGRSGSGSYETAFMLRFNGQTSTYLTQDLYGTPATGTANSADNSGASAILPDTGTTGASTTANTFGSVFVHIANYAGATYKSVSFDGVSETNGSDSRQGIAAGSWSNTAAITSITVFPNTGSYVQYSTAYLYGLTKGSGGATVS
jgi:hypothetical protein